MKLTIGSQVQELIGKTSGKPFKKFNVKDESGNITQDVVAFPFYSQFNAIVSGAVLEGLLKEGAEFQGRKSYSLVDGNLGAKPSSFGGAKNMELKAQNIAKAQDRKEDGIMISSTARMATEATIACNGGSATPERFKVDWLVWREWFVKNWETTSVPKISGTDIPYPQDINPDDIPF